MSSMYNKEKRFWYNILIASFNRYILKSGFKLLIRSKKFITKLSSRFRICKKDINKSYNIKNCVKTRSNIKLRMEYKVIKNQKSFKLLKSEKMIIINRILLLEYWWLLVLTLNILSVSYQICIIFDSIFIYNYYWKDIIYITFNITHYAYINFKLSRLSYYVIYLIGYYMLILLFVFIQFYKIKEKNQSFE